MTFVSRIEGPDSYFEVILYKLGASLVAGTLLVAISAKQIKSRMSNIMIRTKVVEESVGSDSESLGNVEADASDLLGGKQVYEKTLRFGPSLVSFSLIKFYEVKGFFPARVGKAPDPNETIHAPQDGGDVVFREFLKLGFGSLAPIAWP